MVLRETDKTQAAAPTDANALAPSAVYVREVEGETYIATSMLASEFGYDADHIGRLARQGKVKSLREGKRWFISRTSLESYQREADLQKKVRALESIKVSRTAQRRSFLRKPITVPSFALFHIAERVRASRINLGVSLHGGALRFILLALLLFGISSVRIPEGLQDSASILDLSKNDIKTDLQKRQGIVKTSLQSFFNAASLQESSTLALRTQQPSVKKQNGFLDDLLAINRMVLDPFNAGVRSLTQVVHEQLAVGSDELRNFDIVPSAPKYSFISISDPRRIARTSMTLPPISDASLDYLKSDLQKSVLRTSNYAFASSVGKFLNVPPKEHQDRIFVRKDDPRGSPSKTFNSIRTGILSLMRGVDQELSVGSANLLSFGKKLRTPSRVQEPVVIREPAVTQTQEQSPHKTLALPSWGAPMRFSFLESYTRRESFAPHLAFLHRQSITQNETLQLSRPREIADDANFLADLQHFNQRILKPIDSTIYGFVATIDFQLAQNTQSLISVFSIPERRIQPSIAISNYRNIAQKNLPEPAWGAPTPDLPTIVSYVRRSTYDATRFSIGISTPAPIPANTTSLTFLPREFEIESPVENFLGTASDFLISSIENVADFTNGAYRNFHHDDESTFLAQISRYQKTLETPAPKPQYAFPLDALPEFLKFPTPPPRPPATPRPRPTPTPSRPATSYFSQAQTTELNNLMRRYVGNALAAYSPVTPLTLKQDIESLKSQVLALQQRLPIPLQYTGNNYQSGNLSGDKLTIDNVQIDGNSISVTTGTLALPSSLKLGDVTYTWPGDNGTSNQVLSTDGEGTLSWTTVSGVGGGVSSNSLNFDEFQSALIVDTNTTITAGSSALVFDHASISSNFEVGGYSSASAFFGGGLSDCDAGVGNKALNWSSETGRFSCTDDDAGGGGGTLIEVRDGFSGSGTNVSSVSFEANSFAVTFSGTEALVRLDWTNGPASKAAAQTISGLWKFTAASGQFTNTLEIGTASVSAFFGAGLTDCDAGVGNKALNWSSETGRFSCTDDDAGGGGGALIEVRESSAASGTNVSSVSFSAGNFDISFSGTEAIVELDWLNGPASRAADETITGKWTFTNASISSSLELTSATAKLGVNAGAATNTTFEVGGTASISGALTLAGGITSSHTASNTFSGSLDVTKGIRGLDITATGKLNVTGNILQLGSSTLTTGTGAIALNGNTTAGLTFTATGLATFNGGVSVSTNFELTNSNAKLGVNAGAATNTTFEVGGTASISGTLTLAGGIVSTNTASNTFSGSLDPSKGVHAGGNISTTAQFISTGASSNSFTGSLNTTLGLHATTNVSAGGRFLGIGVGSNSFLGSLDVSKGIRGLDVTANGKLNVTGNILQLGSSTLTTGTGAVALKGNTTAELAFTATGLATFNGGVSVSTNFELTSNTRLGINAGAATNTSLEVGGTASISGTLTLTGGIVSTNTASNTFQGSLDVTKGVHASGNITTSAQVIITGAVSNSFSGSLDVSKGIRGLDITASGRLVAVGQTLLTTATTSSNFEARGYASASAFILPSTTGATLGDCDSETQTLNWDVTTRQFTCLTDGGGASSNSLNFDEFQDALVLDADTTITGGARSLTFDHASVSGTFEVTGDLQFFGEIRPDGVTCSIGQILKKAGANDWDCDDDDTSAGAGVSTIQLSDSTIEGAATTIDFTGAHFVVTSAPAGEANIRLSWDAGGPASLSENELVSGKWTFGNHVSISSGSNLEVTGFASASKTFGSGLTDCDDSGQAIRWTASGSAAGKFSCGSAGGGGDAGFGIEAINAFTADGTWVKNAFVGNVYVEVWGGGGGGGRGAINGSTPGAGGGGGGYTAGITTVSANVDVVVAQGGLGALPGTRGAEEGNFSSFPAAINLQANGGGGGANNGSVAGIGGTSSNGTITLSGLNGQIVMNSVDEGAFGGAGGGSPRGGAGGFGGNNSAANKPGFNGGAPGGGGGGATGINASSLGGKGGTGLVIVWALSGTNGSDLAEFFVVEDGVEPGDVVAIGANDSFYDTKHGLQKTSVLKKATPNDRVVGVVSTNPFQIMNRELGAQRPSDTQPIALAGTAHVKVSLANGPIKKGDLLTASDEPGVAVRTDKAGQVIGSALEDYNQSIIDSLSNAVASESAAFPLSEGKILMFVATSHSTGARTNAILEKYGVSSSNIPSTIDMGRLILAQMLSHKQEITASTSLSEMHTDRVMAGLEIISPRVLTDTLVVNTIEPVDKDVGLRLQSGGAFNIYNIASGSLSTTFGDLASSSGTGPPVISFDNLGNAFFAGHLTVSEITADRINGLEIITGKITQLSGAVASISTAQERIDIANMSVFGSASFNTLRAFTIVVENIESPVLNIMNGVLGILSSKSIELESRVAELEVGFDGLTASMSTGFDPTQDVNFGAGLTVESSAIFKGGLIVTQIGSAGGLVLLNSDVNFFGRPYFNADTAGFAVVPEGKQEVQIVFSDEYLDEPVINVAQSLGDDADTLIEAQTFSDGVRYLISRKNTKGFTIVLDRPAPRDMRFNWIALAVKNAKTFTPISEPIPEIILPTPEIVVEPTSTPVPADESTPEPTPTPEVVPDESPIPSETPLESILTPTPTPEPTSEETLVPEPTPEDESTEISADQ